MRKNSSGSDTKPSRCATGVKGRIAPIPRGSSLRARRRPSAAARRRPEPGPSRVLPQRCRSCLVGRLVLLALREVARGLPDGAPPRPPRSHAALPDGALPRPRRSHASLPGDRLSRQRRNRPAMPGRSCLFSCIEGFEMSMCGRRRRRRLLVRPAFRVRGRVRPADRWVAVLRRASARRRARQDTATGGARRSSSTATNSACRCASPSGTSPSLTLRIHACPRPVSRTPRSTGRNGCRSTSAPARAAIARLRLSAAAALLDG